MNLVTITEQKVQALEAEFLKQPQVDCSVVHRFGPGIYIREVTIPADTFSIGHCQTATHLNIMLAGRVTMVNPDGSHTELVAPQTFVSGPGSQDRLYPRNNNMAKRLRHGRNRRRKARSNVFR